MSASLDLRPLLALTFQPVIDCGSQRTFAWHAVATARSGRSFCATAAALAPEQRPALEAARIALSVETAVRAGLRDGDAFLAIRVDAPAGMAEALLSHLFRVALAWRFPVERIIVSIDVDERGDPGCAAALAQACTRRGIAIALDEFAAGPIALRLLGRFSPAFVTLAPALVRNIAASPSRRPIAEGILRLARGMDVIVAARGVASAQDYNMLDTIGVRHFQLDGASQPPTSASRPDARTAPPHSRRPARQPRAAPSRPVVAAGLAIAI